MRMKSLVIILAFALCAANTFSIAVAESPSLSSTVASSTDSSANLVTASGTVVYVLSSIGQSTDSSALNEALPYIDAAMPVKAIGKVAINNPSSIKAAAINRGGRSYPAQSPAGETDEMYSASRSSGSHTGGQMVNLGTETVEFDMHGMITDVLSPSTILIGREAVNLRLDYIDSSYLEKGEYELLMDYLKYKLIGKEVYVKDNYAYFDLNGAISSASVNDMIQGEIWGKITSQMNYPVSAGAAGGSGSSWNGGSTGDNGSGGSEGDESNGDSTEGDGDGNEDSTEGDGNGSGDSTGGNEGDDTIDDNENEDPMGDTESDDAAGDDGGSEGYSVNDDSSVDPTNEYISNEDANDENSLDEGSTNEYTTGIEPEGDEGGTTASAGEYA